ncbi:DNA-binding PadR family transcriptional regulator [Natranaerovirga hydrolytica]|uniref:DNA-binding PadR family transcriptional regulator n=1 Tax=Natranaerovirga hydrolytica TaxID=680378 RepID=A0A4R1M6K1_9FIRM|nr:PadR family transcriptional regulator [Natranaerovirga hydrolytica]TCK87876.1 DNA-binding PadR family transcriptional regulator [Natranaerovirga hydrolytica]
MSVMKGKNFRHLNAFILLALAKEDNHGGGVYTVLSETLPNFNVDTGAIYRCLKELESNGAVEFKWENPEKGPAKKVYTITEVGFKELKEWEKDIESRLANLKYFLETYRQLNQ